MCSKPVFCEYFTQKLLLRKTKKKLEVARTAKSCSKVADHNRDRPPSSPPHSPPPPEKLDFSLIGTILDDLGVGGKGRALFFFAKRGKFLFARNYSI